MAERTCAIEDCERPPWGRGYCPTHYQRWRKYGDPLHTVVSGRDEPLLTRILKRLDVGDCWEWTGYISTKGYGRIKFGGVLYEVHRALWGELVGPIPAGMSIDHLCRNTRCANPDHLEVVTHRENVLRGYNPPAKNARRAAHA